MKHNLLFRILLAAAGFLLAACGGSGEVDDKPASLAVSPTAFDFGAEADGGEIVVTASGEWTMTQTDGTESWCRTDCNAGRGDARIALRVEANEGAARSAVLTFRSAGCAPVGVTVAQGRRETTFTEVAAEPDAWDGERRGQITYQLLLYSFADGNGDRIGDLAGLRQQLDYIEALGASAVWLSPIHPADSYHGYDVTDYDAVHPDYGTLEEFEAFVAEAHARGIRVYLDYVINHTGKGHPWFAEALSSETSPYRDWYLFSTDPEADLREGRFAMLTSGYDASKWRNAPVTSGDDEARRYRFVLDWSDASAPVLTAEPTDDEPLEGDEPAVDRFLYFGSPARNARFAARGDDRYELVVDYLSPWGLLVRTSDDPSWPAGTKYGAPNAQTKLTPGQPFTLRRDGADILFADMKTWRYYSEFATDYMPDLNYGAVGSFRESAPYRAIVASARGWIDRGVDGLRLDAAKHIYSDEQGAENPAFWAGFYDDVNARYRETHADDIYMVGEVLSDAQHVAPHYRGLPALFEFSFWWTLRERLNSGRGNDFCATVGSFRTLYEGYRSGAVAATKLSNHDEARAATDLGGSEGKMRVAAAVLLTASGAPYLYQGEELGYTGSQSGGDEYVRAPMLWDAAGSRLADGALSGKVDRSMLTAARSVERQAADDTSLLSLYRTFARLRNTYPALARGTMTPHGVYNASDTEYASIAAWYREADGERMLVLHNFSSADRQLRLTDAVERAVGVQGSVRRGDGDDAALLEMGPYSSVVFLLER